MASDELEISVLLHADYVWIHSPAVNAVMHESSDEKYRKYFDHRLFQFKPLPLLPFLFHAYTYFQNTVLNFFSIGTFFFFVLIRSCASVHVVII